MNKVFFSVFISLSRHLKENPLACNCSSKWLQRLSLNALTGSSGPSVDAVTCSHNNGLARLSDVVIENCGKYNYFQFDCYAHFCFVLSPVAKLATLQNSNLPIRQAMFVIFFHPGAIWTIFQAVELIC